MANPEAANILVASPLATGGILTAATGTAVPTTVDGSTSAFTGAGYIGDAGVSMTVDRQTQDVFAWGGDKVRVIQTSHSVQLEIPFLEANAAVLALVFGEDNVSVVGAVTTVNVNGTMLPHFALVIDAQDGDKRVRITAEDAQVISQQDITFVHTAPTMFTVTVELFPGTDNNKAILLYDDGSDES